MRASLAWDEPKQLIGNVYRRWLGTLRIAPSRAATTLLFVACRDNGEAFAAQLGDGLVLYRSEGRFGILTAARDGFSNQTNALGISKSWADWQCTALQLKIPGDGVLLMTDGVSDDLKPERLEAFFQKVYRECSRRSRRGARNWLRTQLEEWPTINHSDDKTIAMIFRGTK